MNLTLGQESNQSIRTDETGIGSLGPVLFNWYFSPEIGTRFILSHMVRGLPFMVQRNGLAMVSLK